MTGKLIYKILPLFIALIITVLPSDYAYCQVMGGNGTATDIYNRGKTKNNMGLPIEGMVQQPTDSIGKKKEKKEKKPLESYLFGDSTKKQNVFSWMFNPQNNNINFVAIDTMLNDFNKDYLFFRKEKAGVIYNGNLGGANTPLDFFARRNMQNFSFLDAYSSYLYFPDNVPFYNSKRPFTQFAFFMSGQTKRAEEQLRVLHAQNVSPSSSFNIEYRNNATRGMYNNQRSKDKNLSVAFDHTGKRYTVHTGYIYNMGNIGENGGLTNDTFVKDTLIDLPENLPINMKDAQNKFYGHTFYITQSYGMPFRSLKDEDSELRDKSAIFFGHSFEFTGFKKTYTDTYEQTVEGYYKDWFLDRTYTKDSLKESKIDTKFFLQLQPYNREGAFGLVDGGIGYTHESYYNFQPSDYIFKSKNTTRSSVYVYANGGGQVKKYFKWNGNFKYYPIGYRSQDMNVGGNLELSVPIKGKPLTLTAGALYRMENPSFWSEHYYSNHFMWENSFVKENETRFEASLSMADYGIEVGIKQSIINNKIYYDENSLPAQFKDALSVTGIFLQKDFRLGGLNLKNRVLLQWSSSQKVAPVQLVSANAMYYYEFNVVKNVLRMQVGVDAYFNTSYYGFGYNPAIMQFYNQQTTKTGDYIWLDAFVSGKWKRVRFLVKMQHLNYELFGGRNYFQVAHYPLNRRMLKLGISWNFYD
ncbi:MAG: putative porin [Rikenellaceae bacterium]